MAATDSDIARGAVGAGGAGAASAGGAGEVAVGGGAAALPRKACAWTPSGMATANSAVAIRAPRAPWLVTLRARIMDEIIPSFGRVRPQFLVSIKWCAQCGER